MAHGTHWKRLGDGSLLTQDAEEGLGHILPLQVYLRTLGMLLGLTVLTVIVSRFDFGSFNVIVALIVASIKALLVALFFMHLKFENRVILLFALYPVILLFLFVGSNVLDVVDRKPIYPSYGPDALRAEPTPAAKPHGSH